MNKGTKEKGVKKGTNHERREKTLCEEREGGRDVRVACDWGFLMCSHCASCDEHDKAHGDGNDAIQQEAVHPVETQHASHTSSCTARHAACKLQLVGVCSHLFALKLLASAAHSL